MQVEGQAAIVSGGGSGLGRATAQALAAAGVKVAILDINEAAAGEAARETGGLAIGADVADAKSVEAAFATARERHGPARIAVTPDGRHAIVSGGPNTITASATKLSGMLHILDLAARTQVATVTGVGIDPYGLVIVDAIDGD